MTDQTNLPSTVTVPTTSLLMDPSSFEHLYRVGKMLAMSSLFPAHLKNGNADQAAANGALVMNMAMRLNEDPLTVAQNIYFVGGKPGWSASYMISKANQHGVFKDPIDWLVEGEGDTLSVTAVAVLGSTGKKVSATCGMEMAKAEGWTKNAKYKSMPEQMLRYRSATFLIRLYCPEVMIGIPSQVEIEFETMRDVTPRDFSDHTRAQTRGTGDITPKEPEQKSATSSSQNDSSDEVVDSTANDAGEKDEESTKDQPSESQNDNKGEEQSAAETFEKYRSLMMTIISDMTDAQDINEVLALYEPQIAKMKQEAPDIYKDLDQEIQGFREEREAN